MSTMSRRRRTIDDGFRTDEPTRPDPSSRLRAPARRIDAQWRREGDPGAVEDDVAARLVDDSVEGFDEGLAGGQVDIADEA